MRPFRRKVAQAAVGLAALLATESYAASTSLSNRLTTTALASGASFTGPGRQSQAAGSAYACGGYTDNPLNTIEIDQSLDGSTWAPVMSGTLASYKDGYIAILVNSSQTFRCKLSNAALKADGTTPNPAETILYLYDGFYGGPITPSIPQ